MRGIQYLHPTVRAKAEQLQAICNLLKVPLLITATWRTEAEQNQCHADGKSKAKYPNSAHCWGVAADFCKNSKDGAFDDPAFFEGIGTLAKMFGLYWGGDFTNPDMPHLEDRTFVPNGSCSALKSAYGTPEKFKATWPGAAPKTRPVLRRGDKGQDVADMQDLLNEAGTSKEVLKTDGSFGPASERVLKEFQQAHVPPADGVCGPKTWAALEK